MQGRELAQFVSDFTWYLRNLMLAKATDNIEDVIDASTENLARLKEEAEMAELDTIMRYIRIFSELSGQLRYASQKRILTEIALIKLCRPAMETTDDAILERIRQVENKVENAAILPEGMDLTGLGGGVPAASGSMPAREKPVLPKAIPEDVKQLVSKWQSVVGNTENPMKLYLKSAKLSLGGDNRLQVVLQDGLASDYFLKNETNREQLERVVSDFAGKQIAIDFQAVGDEREFEDSYVDLTKLIHMEIEEVDE